MSMTRSAVLLPIALATALCAACVEKGPPPVDQNYVAANLLTAEPAPKRKLDADLGGKVVYLGADLDKDTLKPGDKLTLVHYWKVVQPVGSGWRVFCHITGASKSDWMNIDAPAKMRDNYPPDRWKAGDIIRDEQVVSLKGDWQSAFAEIHVGLYRKGSSSERDRMPIVTGPSDGHSGVLVARLPVAGKGPAAPAGAAGAASYVIRRAAGAITVDGKADEPSWTQAASTGPFKDADGGQPVGAATMARLLWDDKHLYAFIDVTDKDIHSSYTKNDDPLWKEDVVELFIDANRDGKGYVELQVNPRNAQFDAWFPGTRATSKGDEKWNAGIVSAVTVDGTLDQRDDADRLWHVEMAIPLEAVKGGDPAMAITLPPRPGDKWKLNVVRVEKPRDKGIAASAWAQITIQDFHAIDRLLEVTFGDDKGATAAAPAPGPAPAPVQVVAQPVPAVVPPSPDVKTAPK